MKTKAKLIIAIFLFGIITIIIADITFLIIMANDFLPNTSKCLPDTLKYFVGF